MRLTVRLRALIALLVFVALGYLYCYVNLFVLVSLAQWYRHGSTNCDTSWRNYLNGCDTGFRPWLGWLELISMSMLLLIIAYGLARWVAIPLRRITENVAQFGPNSLGMRLRANGPRDETRELADAIDTMLDRLAAGYESQRRFASNASHELRTPLATQRALIEISLGSTLTSEQMELLTRQLLSTNERNERLIDGLLTLAETDRGLASRLPVHLDQLASAALAVQAPRAATRQVVFSTAIEPCVVMGEDALLERLAANLVENAIKYNDTGGTVGVRVTRDGALVVANTGPVVPPDQVGALFEPFRRLAGERLDHGNGVGLGLTIVRSIVAAHGGSIVAVANPEGGLTVTVRLPTA